MHGNANIWFISYSLWHLLKYLISRIKLLLKTNYGSIQTQMSRHLKQSSLTLIQFGRKIFFSLLHLESSLLLKKWANFTKKYIIIIQNSVWTCFSLTCSLKISSWLMKWLSMIEIFLNSILLNRKLLMGMNIQ